MNKYIEVKIPILDNVKELEVVNTFNQEQLWYVCAIAKAFEKREQENILLKLILNNIKDYVCSDKLLNILASPRINKLGETHYDLIKNDILKIIESGIEL